MYFVNAFVKQNIKDLTKYSKLLYWDITQENLIQAKEVISHKPEVVSEEEFLTIDEIRDYIKKFNHIYSVNITLVEKDTWARFSIKWDKLYVISRVWVWKRELRAIIAHEIEWHYLRKINGQKAKFSILSNWTANYISTEEWLAIHNQNRFLSRKDSKYYSIFERYYFLDYAQKNNYKKLVEEHLKYYEDKYSLAFNYIVRLKRWVKDVTQNYVFTKDVVYLNWFNDIKSFIKNGWKIN